MSKLINKETRDNLNKVYKTTLGEKGENIFTYTKFLNDSGYNEWDNNFNLMLIEYYQTNLLFDDCSLVLFDEKHNIIYGFKIEEESVIKYINSLKLNKYEIDNDFIESIPSLSKIGELHFKTKHYFDFIIDKSKEQAEGDVNFCSDCFDYGNLFNDKVSLLGEYNAFDDLTTGTGLRYTSDYNNMDVNRRMQLYRNYVDNNSDGNNSIDFSAYDGYR